jgi:hypothetical protein
VTATPVPPPPFLDPIVDTDGRLTRTWMAFILAIFNRLGGKSDKVEAAHAAAIGAVSQGTQIVAVGGLHVGGDLSDNVAVAFYRAQTTVANLPVSGVGNGDWAYAQDGRKNGEGAGAGTGVPVWYSAGAWYAVDSGAVVAA